MARSHSIVRTILLTCAAMGASCAVRNAPDDDEAFGERGANIYGGTNDTTSTAVVALQAPGIGNCTGALLAPNVVLTARHCVTPVIAKGGFGCDATGKTYMGGKEVTAQLGDDVAPKDLRVFTGAHVDFKGAPAALAKAIFHLPTKTLCNTDIAVVVLDRNIPGVTPYAIRTKEGPTVGETLRVVGYGMNDIGAPQEAWVEATRLSRTGVKILAVGPVPYLDSATVLGPNEYETGLSSCAGDSGGPQISDTTGAIVGVTVRIHDAPTVGCQLRWGHVSTRLGPFASLIAEAFKLAGGAPVEEGAKWPSSPAPAPTSSSSPPIEPKPAAPPGPSGDDWPCSKTEWLGKQYWTCAADGTRRKCEGGVPLKETCGYGCFSNGDGRDDLCAEKTYSWSCGYSIYMGKQYWTCASGRLFRCTGTTATVVTCPAGCNRLLPGIDDTCK